jgi:hypothetical protein
VFGVAGAGKTRLAGTGANSLIIHPPTDSTASIHESDNVDELVVEHHVDMADAFAYCQQGGADEYDWVWLDGITLWEDHGLDDVFQQVVDLKPQREAHGPDKGEYGVNRRRIMKWIRDMVGLAQAGHFNLGVTALPWNVYDPVREDDIWMPSVGPRDGSLSHKLCGYMNVVAYLRIVERDDKPATRKLYTQAPGFYGKDQISPDGESLNGLPDPTMTSITAALNGGTQTGRRRTKRPARKRR